MAEGSNPSTPPAEGEGTPPETPAATPETTDETPAQSVEEVETIWKNRIAGKDRAHNAEVAALRANLAAAEARAAGKVPTGAGDGSEPNEWQVKYEAEAKAREDERIAHQAEVRAAKYPLAAEALETGVLAQMDEGKLAALNARLDSGEPSPPPRIDPSQPPKRTPAPPTPQADNSVAELESDLKRYSPEYIDRITNQ